MTEIAKSPVKENGKATPQEVGKAKRSDEELKKMGVVGSLIMVTKKAVKLAKANKFEGLDIPEEMELKEAEGAFYRLHKTGGVYERLDPAKETFLKLRELAKKAVPDMMKYKENGAEAANKAAYSANVKAFLKYAAGVEAERKVTGLDMGGLAGIEL